MGLSSIGCTLLVQLCFGRPLRPNQFQDKGGKTDSNMVDLLAVHSLFTGFKFCQLGWAASFHPTVLLTLRQR